ncbi:MAG: mechanosensitive ion channel family protein [Bacteriovoracaceae bacterium]
MKKLIFTACFSAVLLIPQLNAQTPLSSIDDSLKNPRVTMNYFLKAMKAYKLGDKEAINFAILTFDQSKLNQTSKTESSKLLATQMIQTMDRLEYIDVKNIPETLESKKWIYKKELINHEGKLHNVEISIHEMEDGKWRFTPITLSTIPTFYDFVSKKSIVKGVTELRTWKDRLKDRMPKWTSETSFILLNGQWLALLALIFLALLAEKLMRVYVLSLIKKFLLRSKVIYEADSMKKFSLPIGIMTFSGVWWMGVRLLEFQDETLSFLLRVGIVFFTLGSVVCAYTFVDILKIYLEKKALESENKFDDILVPLITKTLKTFIVLIGIIFIGNSLTLDMKSILAGMGIGGIAFALAAKDTISNLFGSLTVLLDRPFRIGDWVVIDGEIEGVVSEVGLRSTRIRTFYDSIITLPNGKLTNAHIDNYGLRTYRRLSTKIGVQYDTPPEKLEAFCEGIRQLIVNHPETRKDSFQVYFNSFGDSALEILVYVFWRVPDWSTELNEKHRFLMDILRLGEKMGISFAFPTTTVHLFQESHDEKNDKEMNLSGELEKADQTASQLSEKTLTPKRPRSSLRDIQNSGL